MMGDTDWHGPEIMIQRITVSGSTHDRIHPSRSFWRYWFAGQAMAAMRSQLISSFNTDDLRGAAILQTAAAKAVMIADAVIEELEKPDAD
jgi:hypothetical protein